VHQEVEELQALLSDHFKGRAETLIHTEPCIMPQCPICGLDPCKLRKKPTSHQALWNREAVTLPEEDAGRLDGIECGAQGKETKNSAP
jgi:hypothetical protein